MVAASLVRKYDADPEPWYELVHDRLVQALPEHFARDQRFLRIRYARELGYTIKLLAEAWFDSKAGTLALHVSPVMLRSQSPLAVDHAVSLPWPRIMLHQDAAES